MDEKSEIEWFIEATGIAIQSLRKGDFAAAGDIFNLLTTVCMGDTIASRSHIAQQYIMKGLRDGEKPVS